MSGGLPSSLQARVTFLSTALFALALIIAEVALVMILRRQLIAEVDRAIDSRLNDLLDFVELVYEIEELDEQDRTELGGLTGTDEIAAIFDYEGYVISISDDTGSPQRLLDLTIDGDDEFATVGLEEFTLTEGTSSMRISSLELFGIDGLSLDGRELTDFEIDQLSDEEYLRAEPTSETPLDIAVVAKSLEGVERTVSTVTRVLLIATPLLTALFAALAWWLAGRTLRPVEQTRREVEEISAGDLTQRVSTTGRSDEIGLLAATMNDMLARIETGQTQQRRFVADASHELRTPLAAMATELDVATAHSDSTTWPETASRVRATVSRMQRLVDDLQLLARSDAGVTAAAGLTRVSLDDLVLEGAYAGGPGAPVAMGSLESVTLAGNADQLRRVIDNLVANARRHATSQVEVSLAEVMENGQTWAILRVDDDGGGVAASDRDHVFDRFARLDDGRTRDRGGSGLGLSICRELVTAHGGTIAVESADLGGASFVVRLPVRADVGG